MTSWVLVWQSIYNQSMIQPSTFSLLMCECGHGLNAFGMLSVQRSVDHHTWCHQKMSCMPSFEKMGIMYGESNGTPSHQELHYELIFTWRTPLRVDLYMTCEDQVFVIDVVVMNLTRKMVVMSVISWSTSVVLELNAIIKICKYKRIHEGHHFILMAIKVHDAPQTWYGSFLLGSVLFFSTIDG